MDVIVGTTATQVEVPGTCIPMLQNLGPGNVYLDTDPNVTTGSGLKLASGAILTLPRKAEDLDNGIFLIADAANTDVRVAQL